MTVFFTGHVCEALNITSATLYQISYRTCFCTLETFFGEKIVGIEARFV